MTNADAIARLSTIRETLVAYIHENTHPECLPTYRFHAVFPDGTWRPYPTREGAESGLIAAVLAKQGSLSDYGPLSDDALTEIADELFQVLDAEEAKGEQA